MLKPVGGVVNLNLLRGFQDVSLEVLERSQRRACIGTLMVCRLSPAAGR